LFSESVSQCVSKKGGKGNNPKNGWERRELRLFTTMIVSKEDSTQRRGGGEDAKSLENRGNGKRVDSNGKKSQPGLAVGERRGA